MGNMLFSTPVAANWLQTLDMTLVFVKPLDNNFDLHTLAQSGAQVLELGVLAFPASPTHAKDVRCLRTSVTYQIKVAQALPA